MTKTFASEGLGRSNYNRKEGERVLSCKKETRGVWMKNKVLIEIEPSSLTFLSSFRDCLSEFRNHVVYLRVWSWKTELWVGRSCNFLNNENIFFRSPNLIWYDLSTFRPYFELPKSVLLIAKYENNLRGGGWNNFSLPILPKQTQNIYLAHWFPSGVF